MSRPEDDSGVGGWSASQINVFARQFAESRAGKSWWSFVNAVREALIDALVVDIVLGQADDDHVMTVAQIRKLRAGIAVRLATHHKLCTELSTELASGGA